MQNDEFTVGQNVLIETITKYFSGEVVKETERTVIIKKAAWVADTGRYNVFATGNIPENADIEMYPENMEITIQRGAIVSSFEWPAPLPSKTQ